MDPSMFPASPIPTQKITPTTALTATPIPTISPVPTSTVTPEPINPTQGVSSSVYRDTAEDILKTMSLEEKIGQLFFVRSRDNKEISDIKTYHLGGYILFADDFKDKTKVEVKDITKEYQDNSIIPMLIGVDEEGGSVNRISKFTQFRSVPFQSPQELYTKGGFDLIKSDTIEKSLLLKSLGINVNLAPVCDVSTDSTDFIYKRSFGKDADMTSEYVKTVVTEMNSQGIGSTLKHFPGYGNNVDTHTGVAIDERSYNTFINKDFLPFEAGIDAGAGSILVSHNIITSVDEDKPASLSPAVHEILRKDIGFDGVIMTDDLSMEAIKQFTSEEEAAVLAIQAGNDLVVASDFNIQIPAVVDSVKEGTLTEERINESVMRILIWKLSLGIIKDNN